MTQKMKLKEMTLIGVMGGLAALLMMFRFPIPFTPPFMDFDLSGVLEIIGGFALGPVAALFIILVKLLLKLVTMGSSSMMTGEIQNFLLSAAYVLPAVFIYGRHKTKKRAMVGMIAGTLLCTVMAVVTNLTIIIPFYVNLMGMTWEGIIEMCSKVNPLMRDVPTMALFGIVPFNLIKYGATSALTLVLYKRISRPMRFFIEDTGRNVYEKERKVW